MWIEKIHEPVDEVLTDEDVYLEDINRIHRRVCMLQCCLCEPEKMWDFGEEMSKLVKEMERRICLLDFEGKNVNSLVIERIITKFYEKRALLYLLREGIITLLMTMEDRLEILHEEVVFSGGINVDKTAEHLYRLKVLVAVIGKLLLRLRGYLDKLPRGNWPITGRRNKEREELTLLREQMMLMDITLEEKDAGKQDMLRKKKKKITRLQFIPPEGFETKPSRGVRDITRFQAAK